MPPNATPILGISTALTVLKASTAPEGFKPDTINSAAKDVVTAAVKRCRGNISNVARDLKIPRRTLWRFIRQHNLSAVVEKARVVENEADRVRAVMKRHHGKIAQMARVLGVSSSSMHRTLRRLGLHDEARSLARGVRDPKCFGMTTPNVLGSKT
jgi:transcriptional regulator of acetoin/glycerol metabolism